MRIVVCQRIHVTQILVLILMIFSNFIETFDILDSTFNEILISLSILKNNLSKHEMINITLTFYQDVCICNEIEDFDNNSSDNRLDD